MIFVPATYADIDELATFVNNAYRGKTAEAGWASEAKVIAGQRIDSTLLAETLANGKATILLMRDHHKTPIAGCVSLEPTDEPALWYLSMLAIDPQRQADGLGRTLLSYAENYVKASGAQRVRITVIWLVIISSSGTNVADIVARARQSHSPMMTNGLGCRRGTTFILRYLRRSSSRLIRHPKRIFSLRYWPPPLVARASNARASNKMNPQSQPSYILRKLSRTQFSSGTPCQS